MVTINVAFADIHYFGAPKASWAGELVDLPTTHTALAVARARYHPRNMHFFSKTFNEKKKLKVVSLFELK